MRLPPIVPAALLLAAVLVVCLAIPGRAQARFTNVRAVAGNIFATDRLDPPTNLTASGGDSVSLSWTATVDTYASGYRVLRSTTASGPYSQIAQVTPRTTTTYGDSPGAGTFYYVVRAYYQNWESANSNEVAASVITFRSADSAAAGSGVLTLTINKPSGTVNGEVMVASIAVRPNSAVITPPSGWTLVRRMDNVNPNANSLAVYYKVAGASEPASYDWTFDTSTGSAGGIQTFQGVSTNNPIDVENGQNTANGLTHDTPSVTTTQPDTMLVTSHAFTSAATWTAPGGMTEAFDVASEVVPNAGGIAIEANWVNQAAVGATGVKTATASNDADAGNAHILALRPPSVVRLRNAASAGAPSGTLSLVVGKPTGTAQNDVLVASIAVRPNTAVITPPAGWALVRRIDNASANANSLAVYYLVAGAGEPASYTWTFNTSTGSAGGIQAFSGVFTPAPIEVENGQTTANGLTHTAPSIVTTVANAMIVTSHGFTSAATWIPPTGMAESFDVASIAVPNAGGISIEGNRVRQGAIGATGTKAAVASNDADVGNAHTLALRPAP